MKKKRPVHPLISQLTSALFAYSLLWLFTTEKEVLVVGSALVLVYVVYALASCMVRARNADKERAKKHR